MRELAIHSVGSREVVARRHTAAPQHLQLFREGVKFAPLFHAFVRFVIDHARSRGFDRIYYLTREGEFFSAIHSRIAGVSGSALPAARLLEVSRRSTFAASLRDVSPSALMRLWTLYSTQSLRALLSSLNADVQLYACDAERHRLSLDEPVVHPWQDARVVSFLSDDAIAGRLVASCASQRDLLREYCAGRGITSETTAAAIVDIGWRGTIQDNLALALPSVRFEGHYLGLQRFLNLQPANVRKTAFGPDENGPDSAATSLLRFVTPYEMLTNSSSGSVVGYEKVSHGVRAMRRHHDGEDAVYERYTQAFQDGVVETVSALESAAAAKPIPATTARTEALRLWNELAFNPPRVLAKAYFDLCHDESFGLGAAVMKKAHMPLRLMASALVQRRARVELERRLEATTWPAGLVAAHRVRLLTLLALRRRTLVPAGGEFDRILQRRGGPLRWKRVARALGPARVCCYGAGEFAAAIVRHRDLTQANIVGFIDRDPAKIGRQLGAYPILHTSALSELRPDVVLVTVFRNPVVVAAVESLVREAGLSCPVRADVWE